MVCPPCAAALPELTGPCCRRCGEPLDDPLLDLCLRCGIEERAVDRFVSLGPYDGPWGELVRALKFERETAIARFLADRLARRIRDDGLLDGLDVITFVPMTRRDVRRRGFNQARLLAGGVAKRIGRPLGTLLRKERDTPPQAGLSARQRRTNLRDAFRPVRYGAERVLLVDDIGTTGATGEACARALKQGGHRSVTVLTVARA